MELIPVDRDRDGVIDAINFGLEPGASIRTVNGSRYHHSSVGSKGKATGFVTLNGEIIAFLDREEGGVLDAPVGGLLMLFVVDGPMIFSTEGGGLAIGSFLEGGRFSQAGPFGFQIDVVEGGGSLELTPANRLFIRGTDHRGGVFDFEPFGSGRSKTRVELRPDTLIQIRQPPLNPELPPDFVFLPQSVLVSVECISGPNADDAKCWPLHMSKSGRQRRDDGQLIPINGQLVEPTMRDVTFTLSGATETMAFEFVSVDGIDATGGSSVRSKVNGLILAPLSRVWIGVDETVSPPVRARARSPEDENGDGAVDLVVNRFSDDDSDDSDSDGDSDSDSD